VNWTDFFNSLPGQAIYTMLGMMFLDFLFGVLAAFRDSTFKLDAVAAFLRSSGVKVAMVAIAIVGGYFLKQDLMLTAGYAGAAAYVLSTVGSIIGSIGP
jgi:hypothetical protein